MTEISSQDIIPFKVAGVITLEWLKEFARVSGDLIRFTKTKPSRSRWDYPA